MWNTYLGNALTGFLKSIDTLADPFDPSRKIADSILIMISSEFTRTPNRTGGGGNNDDGGTGAFCFLGSSVAGGSFGDISPMGQIASFDPASGVPLSGAAAPVNEAMVWKTTGKLLGITDAQLNALVPDSQGKAITALLK